VDVPEEESPGSEVLLSINPLEFKLLSPHEPTEEERAMLIEKSIARIRIDEENDKDLVAAIEGSVGPDVWMLLVVRMITRVAMPPRHSPGPEGDADDEGVRHKKEEEEAGVVEKFYERQDALRLKLCDYIMADFPRR
jgi:symplekin